jgi:hypothetical protein
MALKRSYPAEIEDRKQSARAMHTANFYHIADALAEHPQLFEQVLRLRREEMDQAVGLVPWVHIARQVRAQLIDRGIMPEWTSDTNLASVLSRVYRDVIQALLQDVGLYPEVRQELISMIDQKGRYSFSSSALRRALERASLEWMRPALRSLFLLELHREHLKEVSEATAGTARRRGR